MNQTENITIVLLLVSAAVLGAMLVVFHHTGEAPAQAAASSRGGEYIMTAGAYSSARDLLYVVDITAQKLNTYTVNINTGAVERVDGTDLTKIFR
jgi:hypothetical protein